MTDLDVRGAVAGAAAGDADAWNALVDRYAGLVWAVARGEGLSGADAADVSQTTWLRLAEHLGRIRAPERVGSWLATTARHECWRVAKTARLVSSVETEQLASGEAPAADAQVLEAEELQALWQALGSLPPPCRVLLRVLVADPPPTYAEVSEMLGMPIGSIGPRRARCLDRLRELVALFTSADGQPAPSGSRP